MNVPGSSRLLVLCFFLGLVLTLPYLLGNLRQDEVKEFSGITGLYVEETYYYLSMGAQSGTGLKLFKDPYCRIENRAILINPIANFIGNLSHLTNGRIELAFLIFRLFAALFLVFSFWRLSGFFFHDPSKRFFSLLIYTLCAGLSGLQKYFNTLHLFAVDNSVPEINMFISMSGEYYIPLANAVYLLCIGYAYLWLVRDREVQIPLGLSMLLLGTIYIYGLVLCYLVITVMLVPKAKRIIRDAHFRRKLLVILFCPMPIIAYYAWILMLQNESGISDVWIAAPSIVSIALSFGLTFVFAFVRQIQVIIKGPSGDEMFLIAWLWTTLLSTCLPIKFLIPFQLQLLIGIGAPISLLSTSFIFRLQPLMLSISRIIFPIFCGLFLVAGASTNIDFYFKQLDEIGAKKWPMFIDRSLSDAMAQSRLKIPADKKVLVSSHLARLFAYKTTSNVYYDVYPDYIIGPKQRDVSAFIDSFLLQPDRAIRGLKNKNINYLFLEQSLLGDVELIRFKEQLNVLAARVYDNGHIAIYAL